MPTTYAENDIGGKGSIGQLTVLLPFSPSLSASRRQRELVERLHIKSEIKPVEYILSHVSLAQVRTKYLCMYNPRNVSCVVLVILQMNEMLFYSTEQYKDGW